MHLPIYLSLQYIMQCKYLLLFIVLLENKTRKKVHSHSVKMQSSGSSTPKTGWIPGCRNWEFSGCSSNSKGLSGDGVIAMCTIQNKPGHKRSSNWSESAVGSKCEGLNLYPRHCICRVHIYITPCGVIFRAGCEIRVTIGDAAISASMWRSHGWEFEPLALLCHVGEKRVRNGQVRPMSAGLVLPKVTLQATLFFISFGTAIQLSSNLILLCPVPKVRSVFNNRVLSHNSGAIQEQWSWLVLLGQLKGNNWGRELIVFYIQDHILNNTNLPGKGWALVQ